MEESRPAPNNAPPAAITFCAHKKIYNYANIFEYLDQLRLLKDCLVVIAMRDTTGDAFDGRLQQKMEKLGLKENLIRQWRGYIAILANGAVIYEKKGPDGKTGEEYKGEVEGLSLDIVSKPWEAGDDVSIKINGLEYSMHIRGINIVVWDLSHNMLLDSVGFDTHLPSYIFRRCLDLDYKALPATLAGRKRQRLERLTSSPIVLIGPQKACIDFVLQFKDKLVIRQILVTDENMGASDDNLRLPIVRYNIDLVNFGDFVIVCSTSRINYIEIKRRIENNGLAFGMNYISANIAKAILLSNKIFVAYGYCQIEWVTWIFDSAKDKNNIYYLTFQTDWDVKWFNHNLLAEAIYILEIADILLYNGVISAIKRDDFKWTDFCADDCRLYLAPIMSFLGLHPQINKNEMRAINIYGQINNINKAAPITHLFFLKQGNYEALVEKGMTNEEIYNIVSADDYIAKDKIISEFNKWVEYAKYQEQNTDLKMLDYFMANYKNEKIHRDTLHQSNHFYYEMARRINNDLKLLPPEALEDIFANREKNGLEMLEFGDIPILPCVAKALDIKWATPDYKYTILLGDNKTKVKVNFKEYIYMYCDYMRSVAALKRMKVLN